MADEIEEVRITSQKNIWEIKKTNKKKASRASTKKKQRAAKRKLRRKLNKIKYYKTLKKHRYERNTDDLCSAVNFFAIQDMEWTPTKCSSSLPVEIVDWHKQEQIAYWKSRAISLELENRMLKQHLRNVYAQNIVDFFNDATKPSDNPSNPISEEPQSGSSNTKKPNKKYEKEVKPNLPEPETKYRIEEMRKIYGNKADRLISMETGLQLNYERHLEESKPVYWPTLPLKL